jgi:hypothetical protein
MTYRKILDLKLRERIPTIELGKSFPRERRKIHRIALAELPPSLLRRVIRNERLLAHLLALKRRLVKWYEQDRWKKAESI